MQTCLLKTIMRESHLKQQKVEIIGKQPQKRIKALPQSLHNLSPGDRCVQLFLSFVQTNGSFSPLSDHPDLKEIPTKLID